MGGGRAPDPGGIHPSPHRLTRSGVGAALSVFAPAWGVAEEAAAPLKGLCILFKIFRGFAYFWTWGCSLQRLGLTPGVLTRRTR